MKSDAVKIERILNRGKAILDTHPEFMDMPLEKVIDNLDDGTQQMISDRWGTAAWIVVESLESLDPCDLVEPLARVKSGSLTYEYVGYLLQNKCNVNLETLMIEADHQHRFNEVVKFVSSNLPFEKGVYKENIRSILDLMERHINEPECDALISHYAQHLINMHAQRLLLDTIGELNGLAEYRVFCRLQADWYQTSKADAIACIDELIAHHSIWSKKAALRFLNISLHSDRETFESHFSQVEEMINVQVELWDEAIPVLTHYIMKSSNEESVSSCYNKVLNYLNRIPTGAVSEKRIFLESIHLNIELTPDLQALFCAVAASPADKDLYFIKLIAEVLYFPTHKGNWRDAVNVMMEAFCANEYLEDYTAFFAAMSALNFDMAKYCAEITAEAIKYLLSNNAFQVLFGLGLLLHMGDLEQLPFSDSTALTEPQLIRVMKGILYYAADAKRICWAAFQLLRFATDYNDGYIEFCMEYVYGNYPVTLASTAKDYEESDKLSQKRLAEEVLRDQKRVAEKRNPAYQIKDLQPSAEHSYIYRRAMAEQNKQINKKADEQSFFLSRFFGKRVLKYGVRSAFISHGRRGDKDLRVAPFQTLSYEMELPAKYIENPVLYAIERQRYLKELTADAIGNKGVFAPAKGKG